MARRESCAKALHLSATVAASKPEGLVMVNLSISDLVCSRDASTSRINARLALTRTEAVELHKALSNEVRRLGHVA